MDPEGPTPVVSDTAMLASLPAAGVDDFITAAGPGSGSSLLMAELRHIGGALGRPNPGAGAVPMLDGQFVLFGGGLALSPEIAAQGLADAGRLVQAMSPYANDRHYLNFAGHAVDPSTGYSPESWQRLQAIRSSVDPGGMFVANHKVPTGR
jgi:hypothetical protein